MKLDNWHNLGYHKYCTLFPQMKDDEYSGLVSDIKLNGLAENITLIEVEPDQYEILDGRNRHTACMEADVIPQFDVWHGKDALKYAISKNVGRRHLGTGQLAALASEIADASVGQNQHGEQAYTREEAAIIFGTSVKSIGRYRQIAELDETLANDVATGKRSSLAEVLRLAKGEDIHAASNKRIGEMLAEEAKETTEDLPSIISPDTAPIQGVDFMTDPENAPGKEETAPPTEEDVQANADRMERIAKAIEESDDREPAVKMVMTKEQLGDLNAGYAIRLKTGSMTIDITVE